MQVSGYTLAGGR